MRVRITPSGDKFEIAEAANPDSAVYASWAAVESPRYAKNTLYGVLSQWTGYRADKSRDFLERQLRTGMLENSITEGLYITENESIAQVKYDFFKLTAELDEHPRELAAMGEPMAASITIDNEGRVSVYQTEKCRT